MARLEDIAKELGVSKSTVSKALSGAADVSDAMRRSVIEKAVEMGYSRLRRSEEAPKLAVFVCNMDYKTPGDFGYDVLVGFRKLAEPAGYEVCVVELTQELEERTAYDTYMMERNYLSGLFLGLSLENPWLEQFKTCKTPTVLHDNLVRGNPRVTCVAVDNEEALAYAVAYMKELGHQKLGYLGGFPGSHVYQQRHRAFLRALWDQGMEVDKSLALCDGDDQVCLDTHLPELLGRGCTAILCSHDALAAQVLEKCREKGIRVPEEVSVIGIDDLPLCESTQPPLTSLRQNRTGLGKSAFCALKAQMEGVPLSNFLLHTELVKRSSCAEVKK